MVTKLPHNLIRHNARHIKQRTVEYDRHDRRIDNRKTNKDL